MNFICHFKDVWGGRFPKFLLGGNHKYAWRLVSWTVFTPPLSQMCSTAFPIPILSCWLCFLLWKPEVPLITSPYILASYASVLSSVVSLWKSSLAPGKSRALPQLPFSLLKGRVSIIFLSPCLFHQCSKFCYFSTVNKNTEKPLLIPLVALVILPTPISLVSFKATWLRKSWVFMFPVSLSQFCQALAPISAAKPTMGRTSLMSMLPNSVISFQSSEILGKGDYLHHVAYSNNNPPKVFLLLLWSLFLFLLLGPSLYP